MKNRTFWFADYEGLRELLGQTSISTVPSAAARQGGLAGGAVTVDPQIAKALALYPLPNGELLGNGDTGRYYAVRNKESRGDYALVKVDHKISNGGSFNATLLYDDAQVEQPDALLTKQIADSSRRQLIASNTHTFGSAMVSVTRGGISRSESNGGEIAEVLNRRSPTRRSATFPASTSDRSPCQASRAPAAAPAPPITRLKFTSYQVSQDLLMMRGSTPSRRASTSNGCRTTSTIRIRPAVRSTSARWPTSCATCPRVSARSTRSRTRGARCARRWIGGYIQDDLRLTNTLTLNLGLRYEMMTIPTEVDGKVALLKNLTDPTVTVGGKIHDSNPTLKNFAPRIGVAWDPFGTRTTAIRAGFGVFDVLPFLYLYETPLNRSTPLFLQGNALNPPTGSFPRARIRCSACRTCARRGSIPIRPARIASSGISTSSVRSAPGARRSATSARAARTCRSSSAT